MKRICVTLMGLLLLGGISEASRSPAAAASPRQVLRTMPGPGPSMVMPSYHPGISPYNPSPYHPPGWDWWRIYPWSPYNYGRNPYNPAILPYYPPMYPPYYPPTYAAQPSLPDGAMVPHSEAPPVLVPHPTGQLRAAPPDAGVIELRIPDAFGTVQFDGVKTSSTGTTRYYVTPSLPGGKPMSYTVSATWNQNGQAMNAQRTVQVSAGHFSVVDFSKPATPK